MSEDYINIFISGDFAPHLRVNEVINHGDYHLLFNDILPLIKGADIAITNLESPLLESGKPIAKTGPNLKASTTSIKALEYAGFDVVTLANNHIMDYGANGLFSTIKVCDDHHIKHIGAGANLEEAQRIHYYELKNKKIAIINCCEHEWSTTTGDYPGANPINEVSLYYQIREAKHNSDFLLLIIHGGHEMYGLPSPRIKKLYRWFVDLGTDAVIAHHTHCYGGYELYNNKPIVYSLGNFVFDSMQRQTEWNYGVCAVLTIKGNNVESALYPIEQCNDEPGARLLSEDKRKEWVEKSKKKHDIILDDFLLEKEFYDFYKKVKPMYFGFLEPITNKYIQYAVNKGWLPRFIKGAHRRYLLDVINNESHRDMVIKTLLDE